MRWSERWLSEYGTLRVIFLSPGVFYEDPGAPSLLASPKPALNQLQLAYQAAQELGCLSYTHTGFPLVLSRPYLVIPSHNSRYYTYSVP